MGKSNRRKAKSQKRETKPGQGLPPSSPPRETVGHCLKRRLLSPWALTVELAGLIAALVVFWDVYFDTVPEIQSLAPDFSSPFLLPFSVKNPSHIFAMKDVTFYCLVDQLEVATGGRVSGITFTADADNGKTIQP